MRTRTTLLSVLALVAPAAVALAPPAVAAVPTCHGHAATIVGTSGNDTINGTGGRDVIVGRDGDDVIYGHGGNDVICGNAGADVLSGGYGDDRVYGGFDWIHRLSSGSFVLWGDTLRGGPGDDLLVGGYDTRTGIHTKPDRITWDTAIRGLYINLATGVAVGQGRDSFAPAHTWIVGSKYADTINGSPNADLIEGGLGADTINGHGGDDAIIAYATLPHGSLLGSARDTVTGGYGNDDIAINAGSAKGGPGNDQITGHGTAAVDAGSGNDVVDRWVFASAPARAITGGDGRDEVVFAGEDSSGQFYSGTAAWNMASGKTVFQVNRAGAAPVTTYASDFEKGTLETVDVDWTVHGTTGADQLDSCDASASFYAADGNDTLITCGVWDQVFDGGPGTDWLHTPYPDPPGDTYRDHFVTCISVEIMDDPNDCV